MDCPICLNTFSQNEMRTTECQHQFCQSCYTQWFETHDTCPLCRRFTSIIMDDENQLDNINENQLDDINENQLNFSNIIYNNYHTIFNENLNDRFIILDNMRLAIETNDFIRFIDNLEEIVLDIHFDFNLIYEMMDNINYNQFNININEFYYILDNFQNYFMINNNLVY